jgi:FkbM family methyltransferase
MSISLSIKKFKKNIDRFLNTFRCPKTGFLFQLVSGKRVYLRSSSEYLSKKILDKLCTNYYYKHYLPKENDTVVCIGAGLGHEAIWLQNQISNLRYVGVEIQPYLYELLSNTFKEVDNFTACGYAINNDNQNLSLSSAADYTAVTTESKGYIEIHSINWDSFLDKYKLQHINLLQINIEGAERYFLPTINNYQNIDHIIVSAHDFRANRGDGEYFRTRDFVKNYLESIGYLVISCGNKPRQQDWLFASK